MADFPNRPRLPFSSSIQFGGGNPPPNSIYPSIEPQRFRFQTAGSSSIQSLNKPVWQNNRPTLETGNSALRKNEPPVHSWNRRPENPNWQNNAFAGNELKDPKNSGSSPKWVLPPPLNQRENPPKFGVTQNWSSPKVNLINRQNSGPTVWNDRNQESQNFMDRPREERRPFSSVWSSEPQQFSKPPEKQQDRFTESQPPSWNRGGQRPDWTKNSGGPVWKSSVSEDRSDNSKKKNSTWIIGSREPPVCKPAYSEVRQWNNRPRFNDRWTDISSPQNTLPPVARDSKEYPSMNRPQQFEDWSRSNRKSPEPGLKVDQNINRPFKQPFSVTSYSCPRAWSPPEQQQNKYKTDCPKRQYNWNDNQAGNSGFKRPRLENSFKETRNTNLPNFEKTRTESEVHSSPDRPILLKSPPKRNPVSFTDLRRKLDKIDSTSLPTKVVSECYEVAVCHRGKKSQFTNNHMIKVQEKLMADLIKMAQSDNINSQPELKFRGARLASKFHMIIECQDAVTAEWLLQWTPPNLTMRVALPEDLNVTACISFSIRRPFEVKTRVIKRLLRAQNPGLDVVGWTLRKRYVTRKRVNYLFSISGFGLRYLIKHNWELQFCFDKFHVKRVLPHFYRKHR